MTCKYIPYKNAPLSEVKILTVKHLLQGLLYTQKKMHRLTLSSGQYNSHETEYEQNFHCGRVFKEFRESVRGWKLQF